jgi:hypothetical protein
MCPPGPFTTAWVGVIAGLALVLVAPRPVLAQATGVLAVKVTIAAGDGSVALGRRHALLVSDNPPSRSPWRVVTALDGTGKLTLPPGTYTIESEEPLVAQGRTYEWRQTVDVSAGATTTLDLTTGNAEIGAASSSPATPGAPPKTDPWDLLVQWQDAVVALWTPTMHASGVVISPGGLIATTQRVVGQATHVEVQLTPQLKVAARVVAADPRRNAAIVWIDPAALGTRPVLPLGCDGGPGPVIEQGQTISAIGIPVRRQPTTTRGTVQHVTDDTLGTTFDVPLDSAGGPVFGADGTPLGLTSIRPPDARIDTPVPSVVRVRAVCALLAEARPALTGPPPSGAPLPVEPIEVVGEDALREAARRRAGSLAPPKVSSSGFDIEFITPDVAYAGLQGPMDFGQWSTYVADRPAVLLVRVTPRQVESLWLKVARGAAMTQGIALPPITHYEPGFAQMRTTCGSRELTPIHPFIVERRVSETAAIREGLYVFALDAIGPHCGTVTFEVASEKTPDKRESARIEATLLDRLGKDLASYGRGSASAKP